MPPVKMASSSGCACTNATHAPAIRRTVPGARSPWYNTAVPEDALTVGQLHQRMIRALTGAFPDEVWVRGIVRNYSVSRNGHAYFELAEPAVIGTDRARVAVALLSRRRRAVDAQIAEMSGIAIADDLEVCIRGRPGVYAPWGKLQLEMTAIDPAYTMGLLAADRDRVLRALAADGLLDRNVGLPMPVLPLHVGVVTARDSAAYQDFLAELGRRGFGFRLRVVDARVQGSAAVRTMCAALDLLASESPDVVVIVRGGGSRTDLASFDHERLARRVATMPVPVLTGIGHETDRSVVDEVAHTACRTPTAAAAHLAALVGEAHGRALSAWTAVRRAALVALEREESANQRGADRLRRAALAPLTLHAQRFDDHSVRLARVGRAVAGRSAAVLRRRSRVLCSLARRHVDRATAELAHVRDRVPRALLPLAATERALDGHANRLRALDPRRVLERGYSITRRADGSVVRTAATVSRGDELLTQLADGRLRSKVLDASGEIDADRA